MIDTFDSIAEDARQIGADLARLELTHPLTGERSPLSWADEPEPIFWELLTAREIPWYAPGQRFPGKVLEGEVVAIHDAPPTKALRLVGAA